MTNTARVLLYDGSNPNNREFFYLTGSHSPEGIHVHHPDGKVDVGLPDNAPYPPAQPDTIPWHYDDINAEIAGPHRNKDTAARIRYLSQRFQSNTLLIPADFPQSIATQIQQQHGLTVTHESEPFVALRDLTKLKQAQTAALSGIREAYNILAKALATEHTYNGSLTYKGSALTPTDLAAYIRQTVADHGARIPAGELTIQSFRYGQPRDHARAALQQAQQVNPIRNQIKATKWVWINYQAQHTNGYWGEASHLMLLARAGTATDKQRHLHSALSSIQSEARLLTRPGTDTITLNTAMRNNPLRMVHHRQHTPGYTHAHGIGITRHEPPFLDNTHPDDMLRANHVVILKPPISILPQFRTTFLDLHHTHMVHVTSKGPQTINDGKAMPDWTFKTDNVQAR